MHINRCSCGSRLFFHNTRCLACGKEVGICSCCRSFVPFAAVTSEEPQILCQSCDIQLALCSNREKCGCNGTVDRGLTGTACEWCSMSAVIPDLSNATYLKQWSALESAKRKLLYQLELLQLPPYSTTKAEKSLTFQFLSDFVDKDRELKKSSLAIRTDLSR
jgi:hypothetical protein